MTMITRSMTHNYHQNYNKVVKEFNQLMRNCVGFLPCWTEYWPYDLDGMFIKNTHETLSLEINCKNSIIHQVMIRRSYDAIEGHRRCDCVGWWRDPHYERGY